MNKAGVSKDDIIVIFIEPSIDLIIFAVVQLCGMWISLNTNLQIQRIITIVSNIKPNLIISNGNFKSQMNFPQVL